MSNHNREQPFPTKRADEHLIMLIRRHWIEWIGYIFLLIFFNLLPVITIVALYFGLNISIEINGPLYVATILGLSIYYLGAWLMYFHSFIDYRLDMWILTDQRIINIEQEGLFARTISELNITRVQDVTSEVHGHVQTILDYGNVYVQTAGEQQRFIFENVPHPEEISRLVVRANDAATKALQAELNNQPPTPQPTSTEHTTSQKPSELTYHS